MRVRIWFIGVLSTTGLVKKKPVAARRGAWIFASRTGLSALTPWRSRVVRLGPDPVKFDEVKGNAVSHTIWRQGKAVVDGKRLGNVRIEPKAVRFQIGP